MAGGTNTWADGADEGPWWMHGAGEAAQQQRRDDDLAVADLVPTEWATVDVLHRVGAALGQLVTVGLGPATVTGTVAEVGDGWFTLSQRASITLVNASAVASIRGLPANLPVTKPTSRVGQTVVWRQWVRQRARVHVQPQSSPALEGTVLRVGHDHVDLAEHPRDRPPQGTDRVVTLPCAAIAWAEALS